MLISRRYKILVRVTGQLRPDSGRPARTACSRRNARPFAMSPCRDDRDVPPRPCGQRRRELRCVSARLANVRTGPQRAPPSFRQDDKPASISGRHRGIPAEPSPVSPGTPRPPDLCHSAPCEIAPPSAMCALSLPLDSPHHSKIGRHICFLSDTVEFQCADSQHPHWMLLPCKGGARTDDCT